MTFNGKTGISQLFPQRKPEEKIKAAILQKMASLKAFWSPISYLHKWKKAGWSH